MRVLGNLGSAVCTVVAGEHDYEHAQRSGPGHVWVRDLRDPGLRCDRCGMLRTWPGAGASCHGSSYEYERKAGPRRDPLTDEERRGVAEAWSVGEPAVVIARRYNIGITTVRNLARQLGASRPDGRRVPNRAKITLTMAREIREKAAAGTSVRILAREYRVARSTICDVVHRRTWR